ncbi:hypothetical protein [Methanooceanicella nereidis]|uniref:hypothetical protein n=1 Tax=Methanooceanicella nereidis TaxID=2052831 RepID=UPI001E51989D|nr:hypothetical protein [Methanocella sp. CWC-04]
MTMNGKRLYASKIMGAINIGLGTGKKISARSRNIPGKAGQTAFKNYLSARQNGLKA